VRLPEGVDANAIKASFERGVLEVTVPKPEQVKPRRIAISSTGQTPAIESSDGETTAPAEDEPVAA
jgi:HSP20 family protein